MNIQLPTSYKCSSAFSDDKISPASGAAEASGAMVVKTGDSSFFWLLVLLAGVADAFLSGGGMDLVAGDTALATGENIELDFVCVGEAVIGEAEGIASL